MVQAYFWVPRGTGKKMVSRGQGYGVGTLVLFGYLVVQDNICVPSGPG